MDHFESNIEERLTTLKTHYSTLDQKLQQTIA